MGLFGSLRKGVGPDAFAKLARAQALMGGDYMSAARLTGSMQEGRDDRAKAEQEASRMKEISDTIDNDPALATPEAKLYAKANPKAYIENYMSRFQTRQFGPGGGSISTPGAGGATDWQMAPSRHEFQGSVFDVGGGPVGSKAPVVAQQEGTQWVTPQPGTTAFGVNSFTGMPRSGVPATANEPPNRFNAPVPSDFSPGEVVNGFKFRGGDDTDPNNWEPLAGGAGSVAPRPFRRGIFGSR